MPKQTFYVKGMHCSSCELFIERTLKEIKGVTKVTASTKDNSVLIESTSPLDLKDINKKLKGSDYSLSKEKPLENNSDTKTYIFGGIFLVLLLIVLFKSGFLSSINISATSSYPLIFTFGLIAGVSSCAALIGGLVLSLSNSWNSVYGKSDLPLDKIKPHLMFNIGRIISYTLLGAFLGFIGQRFKISGFFTSSLIIIVSILMIFLALQMLGVKAFKNFKISFPKKITTSVSDEKIFKGVFAPFLTGFMTFLLPCGFTLIAEGVAVLASDVVRSSMIMLSFVLGTTIPLLLIGLFSVKLLNDKKVFERFAKIAGIVVILFALYNLNIQLNLFSFAAVRNNSDSTVVADKKNVQVIKTTYTYGNDISPNSFQVEKNKLVRFEIDVQDSGFGCMSTIMVPGLYDRPLVLRKGQTLVMEFTPTEAGSYKITCAMNVPRGVIVVK